ncbi:MAG: glutathione S-transferase family protein [Pseudomonadota bacterium]
MTEIILHNYPQSPVAEKVRVGLGIKGLTWHSVEIPRLPPKPDLIPLTGGYRRTPVMQIGADVYCDSQCIFRALERHAPSPSFFPAGPGLSYALSRWIDGELFNIAVKLVLGGAGSALDPAFAADRGRLYLGADWQERLEEAHTENAHYASQMRVALTWVGDMAARQPFLTGPHPGYADALAYHVVWFLRGRWAGGPDLVSSIPALAAWEKRVRDIGHGTAHEMRASDALDHARAARPATDGPIDTGDPLRADAGDRVAVSPDLDGGEQAIEGRLSRLTAEEVAIRREDPVVGDVCVHFPRSGYRIVRIP